MVGSSMRTVERPNEGRVDDPTRTAAERRSQLSPKAAGHFGAGLYKFLTELTKNNNREWFQANKARYESEVQVPTLRFIADFAPRLEKISRAFVADARPVGGSMMRIYRDVRFAKDKTPYKTNVGAHFRHHVGKDVHAPGIYLHLEPGGSFLGAGMWHPDPKALGKVRDALVEDGARWKKLLSAKSFTARWKLEGESLKRPPTGYAPDHPLIEDLKRKDFIALTSFSEKQTLAADFIDEVTAACTTAAPLARFLTDALGLDF